MEASDNGNQSLEVSDSGTTDFGRVILQKLELLGDKKASKKVSLM
jgi:hypothetical protein